MTFENHRLIIQKETEDKAKKYDIFCTINGYINYLGYMVEPPETQNPYSTEVKIVLTKRKFTKEELLRMSELDIIFHPYRDNGVNQYLSTIDPNRINFPLTRLWLPKDKLYEFDEEGYNLAIRAWTDWKDIYHRIDTKKIMVNELFWFRLLLPIQNLIYYCHGRFDLDFNLSFSIYNYDLFQNFFIWRNNDKL